MIVICEKRKCPENTLGLCNATRIEIIGGKVKCEGFEIIKTKEVSPCQK